MQVKYHIYHTFAAIKARCTNWTASSTVKTFHRPSQARRRNWSLWVSETRNTSGVEITPMCLNRPSPMERLTVERVSECVSKWVSEWVSAWVSECVSEWVCECVWVSEWEGYLIQIGHFAVRVWLINLYNMFPVIYTLPATPSNMPSTRPSVTVPPFFSIRFLSSNTVGVWSCL